MKRKNVQIEIVDSKGRRRTNEAIFKDVLLITNAFLRLFSRIESRMALGVALHSKSIEMGGTKNPEGVPVGMIDEDSLLKFTNFVDEIVGHMDLLEKIVKGKVRIRYDGNALMFSKKELDNANCNAKCGE